LEYFKPFKREKDLILFDRGYPSADMIEYLCVGGFKWLMRIPKGFNAHADSSCGQDSHKRVVNKPRKAL
jgi:hypothetical protein